MGELFRAFGEVPSNPRRRLLHAIADPLDEKKRIAKAREMWNVATGRKYAGRDVPARVPGDSV
jgi:hypothetical protein